MENYIPGLARFGQLFKPSKNTLKYFEKVFEIIATLHMKYHFFRERFLEEVFLI